MQVTWKIGERNTGVLVKEIQIESYTNFVYMNVTDKFLWAGKMQLRCICLKEKKPTQKRINYTAKNL